MLLTQGTISPLLLAAADKVGIWPPKRLFPNALMFNNLPLKVRKESRILVKLPLNELCMFFKCNSFTFHFTFALLF